MTRHGMPIVLVGDLGFQALDLAPQSGARVRVALKGRRALFEELLLPAVEDCWLEIIFIT